MKTPHLTQATLAASVILALSGCGVKSNGTTEGVVRSFNLPSITSGIASGEFKNSAGQTVSASDSAEELALAAEQLAQSSSFIYASRLANEALAVDPTNVRAKLWKAILAPLMEMKGFFTRLEPLAKQNSKRYHDYLKAKQDLQSQTPVKAVSDFFFVGPKDITSEDEIQETISRVTLKMDELRQTMKSMKTEEITIYRNPETVTNEEKWRETQRGCYAYDISRDIIGIQGCDLTGTYQVKLNAADFEVLQQGIAGYQLYIGLLNSYSVHGAIATLEQESPSRTSNDIQNDLLRDPNFGKLRDGKTVAVIPEVATDLVIGARYALQLQDELCVKQGGRYWSRDGYLVNKGRCVRPTNAFDSALKTLELMAKGPTAVDYTANGSVRHVMVDVPKFTSNPPGDLRTLQPTQRNACGRVTQIQDPTVGGLLPNGDISDLLDKDCHH